MGSPFDVSLSVASSGFCISEKNNVYISNNYIVGFKGGWRNGNYFIDILIPGKSVSIYEHDSEDLDFNDVSKKIITKLMESIRYEINTNIHIDKIVNEVLNDEKETSNSNN